MKTKIIIIIALSTFFAMSKDFYPYTEYITDMEVGANTLPLQASRSDIIGIGELESRTNTNALIHVSQYWLGNQQTNIIDILVSEYVPLPIGKTNFVFFLKYRTIITNERILNWRNYEDASNFDDLQPSSIPVLFGRELSVIPVIPENAAIINWCSNLVYASKISQDVQKFYELVRDGYRLNPPSSRMHRDSAWTFFVHGDSFLTTNFIQQIYTDTNLIGWALDGVYNTYWQKTGTSLRDFVPEKNAP